MGLTAAWSRDATDAAMAASSSGAGILMGGSVKPNPKSAAFRQHEGSISKQSARRPRNQE